MTDGSERQDNAGSAVGAAPADVPTARPAALDRLEVLVGNWEMEASFGAGYFGPGAPAVTTRGGRTTFSWLEGRFFMLQRFVVDQPDAPSGITIIGVAAEPEMFAQHYYDSRGVARVYQMTLADGDWTLWRDEPGFWQRYTATISGDGARIDGAWETSADGTEWKHDFGLTYRPSRHWRPASNSGPGRISHHYPGGVRLPRQALSRLPAWRPRALS